MHKFVVMTHMSTEFFLHNPLYGKGPGSNQSGANFNTVLWRRLDVVT